MPTTDEQLLRDFASGRRAALGDLAGRYETALLGLALGLLSGRADLARDAVQETWLRVIRFAANFNGNSAVKTWLYRILINQCHTLGSDERAESARADAMAAQSKSSVPAEPSRKTSPSAAAERNECAARLRRALDDLSPDQKRVILLCYHDGLTHEQSADLLDIPLGTLKSRLHAALTQLRKILPPETPS